MLLKSKALDKIKFVLHVFNHSRSIYFCIDIKVGDQSTDRDDIPISHDIIELHNVWKQVFKT